MNKEIQTQWSLRIGSALSLCAYIKLKTILISSIPNNCPVWGWNPCLSSPSHQGQVQSCCLSCSRHYFLHPTEFRVVLYILSQCSGIPARCQLLFCKISCGWRCSPDVAVERDVLHFHLLLRHLVSFGHLFKMWMFSFDISEFYWILPDSHFQLKKVSRSLLHKASTVGILESKTQIKTNPWRLLNPIYFLLFGKKKSKSYIRSATVLAGTQTWLYKF